MFHWPISLSLCQNHSLYFYTINIFCCHLIGQVPVPSLVTFKACTDSPWPFVIYINFIMNWSSLMKILLGFRSELPWLYRTIWEDLASWWYWITQFICMVCLSIYLDLWRCLSIKFCNFLQEGNCRIVVKSTYSGNKSCIWIPILQFTNYAIWTICAISLAFSFHSCKMGLIYNV